MKIEDLKEKTKQFVHRCVGLAVALPSSPLGKHIHWSNKNE